MFSVEELFSFQKISLLPQKNSCCALPCLLDALLALSSYDDEIIAKAALEVLWNMVMEPAVALAIHDSVVCTLQKMSVFNIGFADLAKSIYTIFGNGSVVGECYVHTIHNNHRCYLKIQYYFTDITGCSG